ncbi:MAG: hypothetical protein EOP84_16915 [Verrucomicrobiaceae bacterium]|nr:MAG: hypothetical protein EOP84_16915 [Verrucomicrobiaceae bacterium]
MKNHRVGLESLHGKMTANGINLQNLDAFPAGDPLAIQALKDKLKKSYEDAGIGDLWSPCQAYLASQGK